MIWSDLDQSAARPSVGLYERDPHPAVTAGWGPRTCPSNLISDMEDIVAVIAVCVGLPWAVFTGIAKVKMASRKAEGDSLRKSELETLIRDAVDEAVEPLQKRIETLEAIAIDDDAPQRRLDAAVLADALEPDLDLEEPAVVQRRARS